jgi:hypothetical protein
MQLDIPQAQAEHTIHPDGVDDDLGRKAMAVVRFGGNFMPSVSPASRLHANPGTRDNVAGNP